MGGIIDIELGRMWKEASRRRHAKAEGFAETLVLFTELHSVTFQQIASFLIRGTTLAFIWRDRIITTISVRIMSTRAEI
jgi:hypothetical protein